MKQYLLKIVLLCVVAHCVCEPVLSSNWKRVGGPFTSLVDMVAVPPVPINSSYASPASEPSQRVISIYNSFASFQTRLFPTVPPVTIPRGVVMDSFFLNLTRQFTVTLAVSSSDSTVSAHGATVSPNGKVVLLALNLKYASSAQLHMTKHPSGVQSLTYCGKETQLAAPGIYIARIDADDWKCDALFGPLSVNGCESTDGAVQLAAVTADGSEWFATSSLHGQCRGSTHGLGMFHHREGQTHSWVLAHGSSVRSLEFSAMALVNGDQSIRRINLGINYEFDSTSAPFISVLSPGGVWVNVTASNKLRGAVLVLATLTGPFLDSKFDVGAVRFLSSDRIMSVSTLHAVSGSQDPLISGLIEVGGSPQAFVAVVAPPGLASTWRHSPILSDSGDSESHITSILSCQVYGSFAFLTFAAHDTHWHFGELSPSLGNRDDVSNIFTVKLHIEPMLMIEKSFLWQAVELPAIPEDEVSLGRAILFPQQKPMGVISFSVESEVTKLSQILIGNAPLGSAAFPGEDSSKHAAMGTASPLAAWGFIVGVFGLTAVVGYVAMRYWRVNGADDWRKMEDSDARADL